MTEVLPEEPVEAVQSNSKRSYKDVLTFPQQRSDSPSGPEPTVVPPPAAAVSNDENIVPPKPGKEPRTKSHPSSLFTLFSWIHAGLIVG